MASAPGNMCQNCYPSAAHPIPSIIRHVPMRLRRVPTIGHSFAPCCGSVETLETPGTIQMRFAPSFNQERRNIGSLRDLHLSAVPSRYNRSDSIIPEREHHLLLVLLLFLLLSLLGTAAAMATAANLMSAIIPTVASSIIR